MPDEPKRLDALVVDVEDSTTLLKLYIGRLMKAPGRSAFYPSLVEHTGEIAEAVASLDSSHPGRDHLARVSDTLSSIAREFGDDRPATLDRILALQETVDLLEAQLDHMLRHGPGAAPEVASSLDRIAASAGVDPAPAAETPAGPAADHSFEHSFEDDPFDEFALTDDFLDELVGGLDAALDASVAAPRDEPSPGVAHAQIARLDAAAVEPGPITLSRAEEDALKELFAQIASSYVGPITDFVGRLRVGPATSGFVDLCLPAVNSLERASASMGYANIQTALAEFAGLLEEVRSSARVVDGDDRARVIASYQRLAELLPSTFPVVAPDPNAESESIILNSLLKQIKGVGRVTIARLFAAGLVSLDAYYVAEPGDLAAASGLRPSLAATICERFRIYREVSELAADSDIVVRRLESLVEDLRAAQFEYKKATLEEWYTHEPSRAKAKARRARQQCMWKINVALAELGELEFLNSVKDEIYDKRIERLQSLLGKRLGRATGELAV
jgi:hypothetical protein